MFAINTHLSVARDLETKNVGTPFNRVPRSNRLKVAEMFNVIKTESNLCRKNLGVHFHTNEIPIYMLAEMIALVTLNGGVMLYTYPGSMFVVIKGIKNLQNHMCIEKIRPLLGCSLKVVKVPPASSKEKNISKKLRNKYRAEIRSEDRFTKQVTSSKDC